MYSSSGNGGDNIFISVTIPQSRSDYTSARFSPAAISVPPVLYNSSLCISNQLQFNLQASNLNSVPPTSKILPTHTSSGKDMQRKILTAHGLRDRRVRLSMQVARKFFDLQDTLGLDKASETIGWLLTKSKSAIDELVKIKHKSCTRIEDKWSRSTTTEASEIGDKRSKYQYLKSKRMVLSGSCPFPVVDYKESRARARARARERTRAKLLIRSLSESNKKLLHVDSRIPPNYHSSTSNNLEPSQ